VQVHYGEGVAIHTGPEPCAGVREGGSEASAGERIGQLLSCERRQSRVPTLYAERKASRSGALARVPERPGVVGDPGMCGRSLCGNREVSSPAGRRLAGPVRAGKARSRSRR
jgi:hypothetical protein